MTDDPWAQFPSSPPPKPGPDWSGFSAKPPDNTPPSDPAQFQIYRGQVAVKPSIGAISGQMKEWSAEQFKQGDIAGYAKGVAGGVAAAPIGFLEGLAQSALDLATLPGDVASGKVKGDDEIIPKAASAAQLMTGSDMVFGHIGETPLIPTKSGDLARMVPDENGKPVARVIGPPPKEADFQAAAKAINPTVAYHGSPYDFDAFDSGKIGTGEGAQSYGHGLYFAEHPEVAKDYSERIVPHARIAELEKQLETLPEGNHRDAVRQEIEKLDQGTQGNQYQVKIHANKDDFLDLDKPANGPEQPAGLRLAYKEANLDLTGAAEYVYHQNQ